LGESPSSATPKDSNLSENMQRPDLEHIIRAGGSIVNAKILMIVGSQAILGQFPDAPMVFLKSIEADVYPKDDPSASEIIEGAIGEESPFHIRFGYYAHGVGPETVVLPRDFETRLIEIKNENTNGYAGLCLEVHDLTISKLVAGREKDFSFVRELLRHKMVQPKMLEALIKNLPVNENKRALVTDRLHRLEEEAAASAPPI
jgi:hypothetical protein